MKAYYVQSLKTDTVSVLKPHMRDTEHISFTSDSSKKVQYIGKLYEKLFALARW